VLARTFERGRWKEYPALLRAARHHGYAVVSLDDWVRAPTGHPDRTLILRHDVDQHPRRALRMAAIEASLGVRSTWYFRWRSAHPAVIDRIRRGGHAVGLHYETLTRMVLGGVPAAEALGATEAARTTLRREIEAFEAAFGPIRSICPHGDTRVPDVDNGVLMRRQDAAAFGVDFDARAVTRGKRIGCWLTDRRGAHGWRDGIDPLDLLAEGTPRVLCVTHPNNWAAGPDLWADRLLSAAVPHTWTWPVRTRSDAPPVG
jgi:hypothetical protein